MSKKNLFILAISTVAISAGVILAIPSNKATQLEAAYGNYTDVDPSTFYSGITNQVGTPLLAKLHDLMVTQHRKYTSYAENGSGLLQAKTDVDPNNSNNIIDFYSGYPLAKEWVPNSTGGYNREHVWCQSLSINTTTGNPLWGENYGGGDIHHIRPEEKDANSTRNNHPYGEIDTHDSTTARYVKGKDGKFIEEAQFGWFKNNVDIFEPLDSKKGDVARIVLYVYTHYTGKDYITGATTNGTLVEGTSCGKLDITKIMSPTTEKACFDMLVKWNKNDPVDNLEITRNNEAAKLTGTRNAFIDHPEYVDYIWGDQAIDTPSVTLDKSSVTLDVGQTTTIKATINNGSGTVRFSSNDKSIATVSTNGVITGVSKGTTTIVASTIINSKTYSATCSVTVNQPVISVTGVSLDQNSSKLEIGDTLQLFETVTPTNATNKNVSWSTSNQNVATVSSTGLVTAKAAGEATITVTTEDGSHTASCEITVNKPHVAVTGLSLDTWSKTVNEGEGFQLVATVSPEEATNKNVIWTSSNEEIATVSNTGYVTTLKAGSCRIYATSEEGNYQRYCNLTVNSINVPVTSVALNASRWDLYVNETMQLTPTVSPTNATNKNVSWSTSNQSVVTVSSTGLVTAKAAGEATITVTTADGNYTAQCVFIVTIKPTFIDTVAIKKSPRYTYYQNNDYIIPDGLVVTTTSTDSVEMDVAYNEETAKDFSFSPSLTTALSSNIKSVVVQYKNIDAGSYSIKVVNKDVVVSEPSNLNMSGTFDDTNKTITWTTEDGCTTVTQNRGGNANAAPNSDYTSAPRVYKGNYLKFESTKAMSKIEITYNGSYYGNDITAGTTISSNVVTNDTRNITKTISTLSGGTHSFEDKTGNGWDILYIQNVCDSTNTQFRFTAIKVTYLNGDSETYVTGYKDILTVSNLDLGTTSTYAGWSNKYVTGGSNARYSGYTAAYSQSNIQINANTNRGITSSTSGGVLKSITFNVHKETSTTSKKYINVYAQNTPFNNPDGSSTAVDVTNATKFTLTASSGEKVSQTFDKDYSYIYFRGNGAIYLSSIEINWEDSASLYSARKWATNFVNDLVCNNGVTAPSATIWNKYAVSYNSLSINAKNIINNGSYQLDGSIVTALDDTYQTIAEAIARYDAVASKYSSTNYQHFIEDRNIASLDINPLLENNFSYVTLIMVLMITLLGFSGLYFSNKKVRINK